MRGERTKEDDPIVAKAREMRARGKSYAVIGRVCKRDAEWAKYWTNADLREKKNKYGSAYYKAKQQ